MNSLIFAVLAGCLATSHAAPCAVDQGKLTAAGHASVTPTPDLIELGVVVEVNATDSDAALVAAATTADAILAAVVAAGGAGATTTNLTAAPWSMSSTDATSFFFLQSIEITSANVSATLLQALTDAASAADPSAFVAQPAQPALSATVRKQATQEALALAIADATESTALLAAAANLTTGSVTSIAFLPEAAPRDGGMPIPVDILPIAAAAAVAEALPTLAAGAGLEQGAPMNGGGPGGMGRRGGPNDAGAPAGAPAGAFGPQDGAQDGTQAGAPAGANDMPMMPGGPGEGGPGVMGPGGPGPHGPAGGPGGDLEVAASVVLETAFCA